MIIFGTRGVTTTPQRGNFNCPQCNTLSNFNLKRVRRFFTLYFIPVIPLDKLGEYVECGRCHGTFDPAVLTYDPSVANQEMEAYYLIACKQVMIAMLLADGTVEDEEVRMLQHQFHQLTGILVPEQELREEIAQVSRQGSSATELLTHLAPQLNASGQEMVIQAAYRIAAADGDFAVSEQAYLSELGKTLGMTQAHLAGVLQTIPSLPQSGTT